VNLRRAVRTVGGSTGFEEGFALEADETKPCKLPRGLNRQGLRNVPRARMPARIVRLSVRGQQKLRVQKVLNRVPQKFGKYS
jgi:hypothetical protein